MSNFSERVEELLRTVETEQLETEAKKEREEKTSGAPWVAGIFDEELRTKAKSEPIRNWDEELRSWKFDPDIYEVVEPVRMSTWEAQTKEGIQQLWAYRAQIRTKSKLTATELELLTAPVKADKRTGKLRPKGKNTFVVPIGDWQIGKSDGDGLEGTVARIEESFENVLKRAKFLRVCGYDIGRLLVVSLGDLGEGCSGHYEQQTFNVSLDRRDQNKVVRRLARNALMKWATEFDEVIVAAVAGNHGENRRNGKSYTSNNDNDDVAVWEAVAETLSVREDLYGHIKWLLPREQLSVSVQVDNKIVGLAHGHQARSGDIGRWWEGQALGGRPVADADILLTGHFHHFRCIEVAKGRWHLQVPAMDGGSLWFEESAGRGSTQGQVTFLLNDNGWSEMAIV